MPANAHPLLLIAVDGSSQSDRALAYGLTLASAQGAAVRIVSVQDPLTLQKEAVTGAGLPVVTIDLGAVAREAVEQAGAAAQKAGVRSTGVVLPPAEPAHAIVKEAKACGANLILVGSHGRTGLARVLLGSVAEKVVRHAHCPVLVVR